MLLHRIVPKFFISIFFFKYLFAVNLVSDYTVFNNLLKAYNGLNKIFHQGSKSQS